MLEKPAPGMIVIDCPACGERQVEARPYHHDIYNELGLLIDRTSWVECSRCKAQLHSRIDALELRALSVQERNAAISVYIPLVARALALISVLISVFPFVGIAVAVIALMANRRPGLWRTLSWLGVGISGLIHVLLFGCIAIQKIQGT